MPKGETKTVKTCLGEIAFDIPQVRDCGFNPVALKKGKRSEQALKLTLGSGMPSGDLFQILTNSQATFSRTFTSSSFGNWYSSVLSFSLFRWQRGQPPQGLLNIRMVGWQGGLEDLQRLL